MKRVKQPSPTRGADGVSLSFTTYLLWPIILLQARICKHAIWSSSSTRTLFPLGRQAKTSCNVRTKRKKCLEWVQLHTVENPTCRSGRGSVPSPPSEVLLQPSRTTGSQIYQPPTQGSNAVHHILLLKLYITHSRDLKRTERCPGTAPLVRMYAVSIPVWPTENLDAALQLSNPSIQLGQRLPCECRPSEAPVGSLPYSHGRVVGAISRRWHHGPIYVPSARLSQTKCTQDPSLGQIMSRDLSSGILRLIFYGFPPN